MFITLFWIEIDVQTIETLFPLIMIWAFFHQMLLCEWVSAVFNVNVEPHSFDKQQNVMCILLQL